jgi:DNA-binding transcriptional LysR family regulator
MKPPLNLRSVDLNLLVALDALLSELHVTRAADRIGLSQPAMSNALARLRHVFRDDLLIRTSGGMTPTPFALSIVEPLRQALRQIERVFDADADFVPTTATNRFAVRMSDLLSFLLLPRLVAEISEAAPGISLDVIHLAPGRTVDALERDELHVAVSMGLSHASSIRSETLLPDMMKCVMRADHPLARRAMSIEDFLSFRHLRISMSPTDTRFVDDALSELHRSRTIALNVPHWLVVPHVLATSDLVAVMPGRLAGAMLDHKLVIREIPFPTEPFEWRVYWHRRYEGSRSVAWLRSKLRTVARALPEEPNGRCAVGIGTG